MGDPDMQELFRRSVGSFGDRVHAIRDDQWTAATPCTEWDVRALVGHLVTEVAWVAPLIGGRSVADVGDELSGDLLGDDPKAAWDRYSGEADSAVGEDGAHGANGAADQPRAAGRRLHVRGLHATC